MLAKLRRSHVTARPAIGFAGFVGRYDQNAVALRRFAMRFFHNVCAA
jgi:hypothetical protein